MSENLKILILRVLVVIVASMLILIFPVFPILSLIIPFSERFINVFYTSLFIIFFSAGLPLTILLIVFNVDIDKKIGKKSKK